MKSNRQPFVVESYMNLTKNKHGNENQYLKNYFV